MDVCRVKAALPIAIIALSLALPATAQDYQRETDRLAEEIAAIVTKAGLRNVAVMDFSDLQGNVQEIGRFIAEELTTSLVLQTRSFRTIDRANLRSLLTEKNLSMTGLVNRENSRKLKISGIDGLIRGSLTPMGDGIRIRIQIIDAETAEIIGGARGMIPKTSTMDNLGGAIEEPGNSPPGGAPLSTTRSSPQAKKGKYVFQDGTLRVTLRYFRKNSANKIKAIFVIENLKDQELALAWEDPQVVDDQGEQWKLADISGISRSRNFDPTRTFPSTPRTVLVVFELEKGASRGTRFNILGPITISDGTRNFSSSPSFQDVALGL